LQALGLDMRELGISLFGLAMFNHDGELIPWLELGVALSIECLCNGHHAFRLAANIHHQVGGGQFEHSAAENFVLHRGHGFGLGCFEIFEYCCKIFHVGFLFVTGNAGCPLAAGVPEVFRMMVACCAGISTLSHVVTWHVVLLSLTRLLLFPWLRVRRGFGCAGWTLFESLIK